MRMSLAMPVSIRTAMRIIRKRKGDAAWSHCAPYRKEMVGSARTAISAAIGTSASTSRGTMRLTPSERVSSSFSDSRENPGSDT